MRTTPLKHVFQGVSALLGAELVQPGTPDFIGIMASINAWLPMGWEYDFWPEFMADPEQRAYRDTWNNTDAFPAGAEVFYAVDGAYYSANSAPNTPVAGESPDGAPTKWTVLTEYARYVSKTQQGLTPIGGVRRVCRRNPDLYPETPGEVRFSITSRGIVPDSRAGTQVWIDFRKLPPVFSSDEYDAATAYAAGDVRFYSTTWECYKALQATTGNAPTNATYWELVAFPTLLKRFVEQACYAATLKPDGAGDKAGTELQLAYSFLLQAQDTELAQQGQSDSVSAVSY